MSKENLVLYQFEDCPYCGLVRRKLSTLGLDCLMKAVPAEGAKRTEVKELSGQQGVPVLKDGDTVLSESSKIIAYLDKTYGNGKGEPMDAKHYDISCQVKGEFAAVREKAIEVFKEQGFGLITEIDVKATMKAKLDIDVEPNNIMGFCNPKIAHQAMEEEPDVGLLLPCNVVIRELAPGLMNIAAISPVKLFTVAGRDDMIGMAEKVKGMLAAGIDQLEKTTF